jgi:type II secretory pathway component PulF
MVAGARSGKLAETLDPMLELSQSVEDMRRRFWRATAYPLILLAILIGWLLFVTLWLLPMWESAFAELELWEDGAAGIVEFGDVFPVFVLWTAIAIVAIVAATRALGGPAAVSRLASLFPLFGRAWWYRSITEFCGLLAVYLRQGLGLHEALSLVALSAHDPAIRQASARAAADVEAGTDLSKALLARSVFPMTLVNVVYWGQTQSALSEALAGAQEMYAERFELQVRLARLVLPPVVLVVVLASVSLVLYATLTPVVRLITDLT